MPTGALLNTVRDRLLASGSDGVAKSELLALLGFPGGGYAAGKTAAGLLRDAGIVTTPAFEHAAFEDRLRASSAGLPVASTSQSSTLTPSANVTTPPEPQQRLSLADIRIPFSAVVSSGDSVQIAVTRMIVAGQNWCAVRKSARELHGVISWESLARCLASGSAAATDSATAVMRSEFQTRDESVSPFDVLTDVASDGIVVTRTPAAGITGHVTAGALLSVMDTLTRPFLQLSRIESELRTLIDGSFTLAELQQARDPRDAKRTIASADDLTFGEYWRLLENDSNWERSSLRAFDRHAMIEWMKRINAIRNDIMHFRPAALEKDDRDSLSRFLAFLLNRR